MHSRHQSARSRQYGWRGFAYGLPAARCRPPAFSLAELLIVIGIIVLALSLAVPALNLITGAKSNEQAQNIVGLMLAQARNEAIGLQRYRGVFFYFDPADERVRMAMVEQVDPAAPADAVDGVDVYLDLVRDRDVAALPQGVSFQALDDARENAAGVALNDRYIGFNMVSAVGSAYGIAVGKIQVPYGPVFLFDGRGQLVSRVYALRTHEKSAKVVDTFQYTRMGVLLFNVDPTDPCPSNERDVVPVATNQTDRVIRSAMGFVLFDLEEFKNAGWTNGDPQIDTALNGASEIGPQGEEDWLDNNGRSLLINRYSGSILKGE